MSRLSVSYEVKPLQVACILDHVLSPNFGIVESFSVLYY